MKTPFKTLVALLLFAVALAIPSFAADPAIVAVGKKVVFSYTVEKGTPPFTQQWFKNGQPIAGATSATFTIARVQESDAGEYTVEVRNAAGSTVSDKGVITLIVPPSGVQLQQQVSEPDPNT